MAFAETGTKSVAGRKVTSTSHPSGIKRIEVSERAGYIDFAEQTRVNPTYLVGLLQSQPRIYRMDGPTRLRFQIPSCDGDARLQLVESLLAELTPSTLRSLCETSFLACSWHSSALNLPWPQIQCMKWR